MAASLIEIVSAPELSCAAWTAACGGTAALLDGGADGAERTNWAAADHTHTALRVRLPVDDDIDDAAWERTFPAGMVAPERYLVEEIDVGAGPWAATPFLYVVRMDVAPPAEEEFNRWYTTDHVANLSQVPGVRCARRFRATNAGADLREYLAIYYLDCPSVRQTAQWQRAAHTDWSIRIRAHHRRKAATMFTRTGPDFVHFGQRRF